MVRRPLLLAHRGAHSYSVGENSLASFDRAFEEGCDGFECDLRRTGCGCAVLSHDAKVDGIPVARATRGQLPGLPRLEDVIRGYGRRGFMDIEVKVRGLENVVLAALRENLPERDYVVSSFLPDVVLALKARSGVVPVGLICGKAGQLMYWKSMPVEYVIVHKSLVTRRLVQVIQSAGRKIFVWTVNDRNSMLRLAGWGVDAIISDKPQLMVETFALSESALADL